MVSRVGMVLAHHRRDMVRTHRPVEPHVFERLHRGEHVGRSVVMPRFDEVISLSLDVAEVSKVDPVAEVTDRLGYVHIHHGEVPLTEWHAIVLAVDDVEDPVVCLNAVGEPQDPTN